MLLHTMPDRMVVQAVRTPSVSTISVLDRDLINRLRAAHASLRDMRIDLGSVGEGDVSRSVPQAWRRRTALAFLARAGPPSGNLAETSWANAGIGAGAGEHVAVMGRPASAIGHPSRPSL